MSSLLNEISLQLEKSTQYYYFTDEMMNVIDKNTKANKWLADYTYSEGPGSDERYVPDDTMDDYIHNDRYTGTEIEYIMNYFQKKGWLNKNEADEKKDEKPKGKYPVGTLIVIKDYGSDDEPSKQSWNGAYGEIREITEKGKYVIRITDVKASKVLFTKKWVGREPEALKQILTITDKDFITLADMEAEAEAEKSKGKF